MDSEQAEGFYEYRNAKLSIRVPTYLHDKEGTGYLEAHSKKDKQRPLFGLAIELQNDDLAEVSREIIMRIIPGFTDEQQGIVRRGRASYLADGIEKLTSGYDVDNRLSCRYDVLFALDGHHIYATFLGQNDLPAFDELCKQIVSSVRLIEGGDEPHPAKRRRSSTGGLSRADKKRLTTALERLPSEIAYLRRPILAIAREDQDLLGSGEGDISTLDNALHRIAKGEDVEAIAKGHADILHRWLLSLPDNDGAWAAPAGFVEGALRGIAAFRSERTDEWS